MLFLKMLSTNNSLTVLSTSGFNNSDAVYVLDDILDECSFKSDRLKGTSFKPKNIMFCREIGKSSKILQADSIKLLKVKRCFFCKWMVLLGKAPLIWLNGAKLALLLPNPKCMDEKMIKRRLSNFFSHSRGARTSSLYIP